MEIPSVEILNKQITDWCVKTFGPDYRFRPYQKEVAVNVLESFFSGTHYYIAECPTGFGKSYMAFAIAGVLSEYYNMTGYILCSDLSLTRQYHDDLDRYLPDWGNLMGIDNYLCSSNGFSFRMGDCQLGGNNSYSQIMNKYYCAKTCPYLNAREKAVNAKVTVCTYQNYLIHQNYVKDKLGENAPFQSRDFIICDEAHNLTNIVQNQFSPVLRKDTVKKLDPIARWNGNKSLEDINVKNTIATIENTVNNIFSFEDPSALLTELETYTECLKTLNSVADIIKKQIAKKHGKDSKSLAKTDKSLLFCCEAVSRQYESFSDYCATIQAAGIRYLIKNPAYDRKSITFNCIDESYLLNKTFHRHIKNCLLMSATIGDPSVFAKDTAISGKACKYARVPSTFDFSRSPIYFINEYKMGYKEKDQSFGPVLRMVEKILDKYPDKQGIIQTGNYEFTNKIYEFISSKYQDRLIRYDSAQMKHEALAMFKDNPTNKVLIGPTLLEGIDLKDDLCRFQIIFKIPYPNLSDQYNKAKMNFSPEWYENKTIISILQGVGRSIRNENDYAVTYILDACFNKLLFKPSMFSTDFLHRLKKISSLEL